VFLLGDERVIYDTIVKLVDSSKKELLAMGDVTRIFKYLKYEMMGKCFEKYKQELDKVLSL